MSVSPWLHLPPFLLRPVLLRLLPLLRPDAPWTAQRPQQPEFHATQLAHLREGSNDAYGVSVSLTNGKARLYTAKTGLVRCFLYRSLSDRYDWTMMEVVQRQQDAVSRWVLISPSLRSCCVTTGRSWIIWCAMIVWAPVNWQRMSKELSRDMTMRRSTQFLLVWLACIRRWVEDGPFPSHKIRPGTNDETSQVSTQSTVMSQELQMQLRGRHVLWQRLKIWNVHCKQHFLHKPSWCEDWSTRSWRPRWQVVCVCVWRRIEKYAESELPHVSLVKKRHVVWVWSGSATTRRSWMMIRSVWRKRADCVKNVQKWVLSSRFCFFPKKHSLQHCSQLSGRWLTTFRSCGCVLTRDWVNVWFFRGFQLFSLFCLWVVIHTLGLMYTHWDPLVSSHASSQNTLDILQSTSRMLTCRLDPDLFAVLEKSTRFYIFWFGNCRNWWGSNFHLVAEQSIHVYVRKTRTQLRLETLELRCGSIASVHRRWTWDQ